jgi:hypothetical protein
VTISVDFDGHGIGRVLVPVVVREEMPANVARLKQRVEDGVRSQGCRPKGHGASAAHGGAN